MDREHVLIIEDDADIREGVRILLESENYEVEEAENGKTLKRTATVSKA